MNFRNRFYKPALLALAVVLLCGVSQMQLLLNRDRTQLGFTKIAPLENAPPVLAFTTVALGGFRGLIANALWIRASELQEDEKYFEMVQLSDWITKLEPHFSQVWTHQAWNMAYNISVKFQNPRDRWRWLQRGIQLLRDEGIRLNPDEAMMYQQLSWMFQQKLGQSLDDAHFFYKMKWKDEMNAVFLGNANFEELLNPQTDDAKKRVGILKEKYKMDPRIMNDVDQLYGPLEWRLPDAHAIYWAEVGRRLAKPKDQETLRRSIYQSMQQACFMGGLAAERNTTNMPLDIGPRLDLVPKVSAAYEQMMAEDPSLLDNMRRAHRNFLKVAVFLLFSDGRQPQAQHWFDYIKEKYPDSLRAGLSLNDYALQQVTSQIKETDKPKTTAIIEGLLRNSFDFLAIDDTDEANVFANMAQRVWEYYATLVPKDQASQGRIGLEPLEVLQKIVLDQMLDPRSGLSPGPAAVLRSRLHLPPPSTGASTNAPAPEPSK